MATHSAFFKVVKKGVFFIFGCFSLVFMCASDQMYDKTSCFSQAQLPGSNYLCNSQKSSCDTFVVYRVQTESQTLSSIASLMAADLSDVLQLNKLNISDGLFPDQEIIIPVTCTCLDRYSRVELFYNYSSESDHITLPDVACVMFEGLVKAQVLMDENQGVAVELGSNVTLKVPLRCACPSPGQRRLHYVTYPVVQQDSLNLIAAKFNVTVKDIADANRMDISSTIYPQTTLLIPTHGPPVVDRTVAEPPLSPVASSFPIDNIANAANSDIRKHYVLLGVGLVGAIVCLILGFFGLVLIQKSYGARDFQFEQLSDKVASRLSNLSPDFITGMSELKHSLINFTSDEIREATNNFDSANMVGSSVFIGRTNKGARYAMQVVESDEAVSHIVYILTRINHLNVVQLLGCCYENSPYLVFEFAENGSLRDCLTCKKTAKQLTWTRRKQIAFDLAFALHYLHYSTKPSYLHCNINSRNVLITNDWRAKISGFGLAKPVMNVSDKLKVSFSQSVIQSRDGYIAPECLLNGAISSKTDVYAFGVVLLELLSAKEAVNNEGKCLKDCVRFLEDGSVQETVNGSSEKLREFMDDALEGEYTLGSAVGVALLAKCCVADDPQLRPDMNDVLRTLSNVV